jgi:26S proteasome non-ATPase regulatory subunit 10
VRDLQGRTALHWAAYAGCEKTTAMLLEAGAARYTQDQAGNTPMHLAASAGRDRVVALLLGLNTRVDVFNTVRAATTASQPRCLLSSQVVSQPHAS